MALPSLEVYRIPFLFLLLLEALPGLVGLPILLHSNHYPRFPVSVLLLHEKVRGRS
jgi:hypothetical protein